MATTVALTVVLVVMLLLAGVGSVVAEVTVMVLDSTVPGAVALATPTTKLNTPLPAGTEARLQLTTPLAPTAGVVQAQPEAALSDTKVVLAGSVSFHCALAAAPGPLLLTVTV